MVRRAVSNDESVQICTLRAAGHSTDDVARRLNRSKSVISRVYNRFLETQGYRRRAGQGRRRITTPREDRALQNNATRNRKLSTLELAQSHETTTGSRISRETARRRLKEVRVYIFLRFLKSSATKGIGNIMFRQLGAFGKKKNEAGSTIRDQN